METFEKTYGRFVVSFNNDNEYVEMGTLDENPKFAGILIREQFTSNGVELYTEHIKFFLHELSKLEMPEREATPLVKLINMFGWNNYHSDFVIAVSTYREIRCKFFMDVSHQYHLTHDTIRTHSPEFTLDQIIEILKDAEALIEDKSEGN